MPAALADPDELDAAIDAARKRLERAQTPDPRPVPHRKTERIEQAQQRLATEDAAQRGAKQAAAQAYLDRIAAGEKITGSPPAGAAVALAEQRLAEIRQAYEAKTAARAAAKAAGKPCRGRKSVPVEQYSRVRRQQAKLDAARAAEANRARADADRVDGRCANMTDPPVTAAADP